MNTNTTWRLFFAAAGLFAFIYFVERHTKGPKGPATKPPVFGKLSAANVTGLDIRATNLAIRAERTNETWRLTTPFYPAQSTPIESFVAALTKLPRLETISATEIAAQPGKLKDFGLDPPVASFTVFEGTNRYYLHIGVRLPLVDQVYAQAPGSGEAIVTDASILKALPGSVNEWRSPMLTQLREKPFDHVQIRFGPRLLEFQRDTTNQVWRISKPTPARANNERITQLLQQLGAAQVKDFITDSPTADLERYGLQTPELELSFAVETNRVASLEFGGSPTNDPASVYVRRLANTNIVTVDRKLLQDLSQPYQAFRDPRLISVDPAQISVLQFKGTNSTFTLARQTNGTWRVTEPTPMNVDPELLRAFVTLLLGMEVVDFPKDVPTDADLKQFGLAPPLMSVSLFSARTNAAGAITNGLMAQIDLGAQKGEDAIYARRSDEAPVYVTPLADVLMLPKFGWQLRDRRAFDFASSNVATLILTVNGAPNRIGRGPQGWSADAIQNEAIEEIVARLGQLRAYQWEDKGAVSAARMARLGFGPDSPILEAQVIRDGVPIPTIILFGKRAIRNNIYAATVLPGEQELTLFHFPGDLYDLMVRAGLMPPR